MSLMQFFGEDESFLPLDVEGLTLWLDPTDEGTVTKNGSDEISRVEDKSGNGLDLVHNAVFSAAKPVYDVDGAIQFDGTNSWNVCGGDGGLGDSDEFSFLHNGDGGTVVMVVKIDSSNANSFAALFSTAGFVTTGQTGTAAWFRDDGAYNSQLATNIVSTSGQVSLNIHADYGMEIGRYMILTLKIGKDVTGSDNDFTSKINHALYDSVDRNGLAYQDADSNWGFLLGSSGSGTVGESRFKEILVYNRYLDDKDALNIVEYLNAKHSVYSREVPVHVILGQSNAVGYAAINNATDFASLDVVPRALMCDARTDSGWGLLQAGKRNYGLGSTQFGQEMTFGIDTKDDSANEIGMVKYAVGSTSLAVDWAVDGATYLAAIPAVNASLQEIATNLGRAPKITSIIFTQGESDAQGSSFANAYQANLTAFIARVRNEINGANESTLFVIPEIYTDDPATWPAVGTVNTAKANVVAADDNAELITNTGFGTIASDDIHWNAATQESVGSQWSDIVNAAGLS